MRGRHAISDLKRRTKLAILGTATVAICATAAGVASTTASAAENPNWHGPDPTVASIEAARGPFATSQTNVGAGNGFGGGTIYYPTTTSEGKWGAVAMSPGFTADKSSLAWLGPRLASQGFVIFIIDTNTRLDNPPSRGTQLLAALDYLTTKSSVASRIDTSRLAVSGHSMGGGGTLVAATRRPSLKAAIPIAPWSGDKSFNTDQVPTLIFSGSADTIAPPADHANRFYASIPASTPKGLLELRGASHFFPQTANVTLAKYSIAWLKRWVDGDTRYTQFLCPTPKDASLSKAQGVCPSS